jgi:hypothetical protein
MACQDGGRCVRIIAPREEIIKIRVTGSDFAEEKSSII